MDFKWPCTYVFNKKKKRVKRDLAAKERARFEMKRGLSLRQKSGKMFEQNSILFYLLNAEGQKDRRETRKRGKGKMGKVIERGFYFGKFAKSF